MKKKLSTLDAIDVCFIIFRDNCKPDVLKTFQEKVYLMDIPFEKFAKEWYAFVFGAIYHGFSQYAPIFMVLDYVRSIKYFLEEYGYSEKEIIDFLDNQFQAYIKLIIEEKVKECPQLFYKRLLGKTLQEVDKKSVVPLSGAMAMLVANCLDIFEKYEYAKD